MSEHPYLPRRIYGLETELGVAYVPAETQERSRRVTPDEIARYLFRGVVDWGRSSNVFLRNGSRVYLDVGSHPEYATAECDDPTEVTIQDRAGMEILQALADDAEGALAQEELGGDIYLFKNNTDSHGSSYGCHENYLVAREGRFGDFAHQLLPFLITRQLLCGAGRIVPHTGLVLSQRAAHMWDTVSSATTRTRPMINTRDEPHADPAEYRRLHVIIGDSNMAEPTTRLKVGMTEFALRLIESGTPMRDLSLANPAKAMREMAADPTGRVPLELSNGRTASALDLQQEYFTATLDLVARHGDPGPTLTAVLDLWRRGLTAIGTQDFTGVQTELDWVIKRRVLQRYADRHQLPLDDPRIRQLELAYHDLNPRRSLFARLERSGAITRLSTAEQVTAARTVPPQTTRAKLRGDFVAAAEDAGAGHVVDWTSVRLLEKAQRPWSAPMAEPRLPVHTVVVTDPFATSDPDVDELMEAVAHYRAED
ncbi:Pup--protein ligase [Granulicoccus phenolivorans]|uniref:Pup--protein ligase n=1 Tax=Granulicoccus phenolivorans TaxID=266854 RepID=UPI000A8C1AE9|nr:Pup--protein ligase [Granulicoccus phenolivorans]